MPEEGLQPPTPRSAPLDGDGGERVQGWRARYAPRRGRPAPGCLTPEAALHAMREAIQGYAAEAEEAARVAERGGPVTFGLADAECLAARADELAERVVSCGAGVGHEGGNLPDPTRCRHGIYPVLEDIGLPGVRLLRRCHTYVRTQCIWSALILL
jgi:hypothetical protein